MACAERFFIVEKIATNQRKGFAGIFAKLMRQKYPTQELKTGEKMNKERIALERLAKAVDSKWTNRGSTPPKELIGPLELARHVLDDDNSDFDTLLYAKLGVDRFVASKAKLPALSLDCLHVES